MPSSAAARTVTAALSLSAAATTQDPQLSRAALDRIEALERRVEQLETPTDEAAADSRWPDVGITGVFHLDGGFQKQSATSVATLGDLDDGLGFRRARIAATGSLGDDLSFIMEFDFAQTQGRLQDVWGQWANTPVGDIRIGRFRQPFGMTELTSIRNLPLLERPSMAAMSPFRQTGIMLRDQAFEGRATWAVAGYRFPSDNFGNVLEDSGYGATTRLTGLVVDGGQDGLRVHLGGDYAHNTAGRAVQFASTNEFLLSQNPAVGPGGLSVQPFDGLVPFVNTGPMAVDSIDLFNVEAAAVQGPFAVQGEARWARVDLDGAGTETFPGGYVTARWVLTGEPIPYDQGNGVLGRVRPARPLRGEDDGWGAFELIARVSHLDLDGAGIPGPGREMTALTAGVSWWPTEHTRAQLEWIHTDLDDRTLGSSTTDTVAFRFQVDF